jgi:dihydroneopterin aldolase
MEGMEFYGFHGCFAEEKSVGSYFKVDCCMYFNTWQAAQTDDLSQTVDYQAVYAEIAQVFRHPVALLETLTYNINQRMLDSFPLIEKVSVKVSKMNPPLGGKVNCVSMEVSSNRMVRAGKRIIKPIRNKRQFGSETKKQL